MVIVAWGSKNKRNGFRMENLNCLSSKIPLPRLFHVPQSQNYHQDPNLDPMGPGLGGEESLSHPQDLPLALVWAGPLAHVVPHADFEAQLKGDLVLEAPLSPESPYASPPTSEAPISLFSDSFPSA